jgi:hypothetical protein
MSAVDYSAARYTSAQLRAAGVTAVGRYITGPYAITKAELNELVLGGIFVWFVYEYLATDTASGAAGGTAHAQKVNAALVALGLPVSQPVYFAADTDLVDPTAGVPYFQGIASVRQFTTNGDYGEGALCAILETEHLTRFHWQSESKAFPGNTTTLSITHIQQSVSTPPLADTDLDFLVKPDYGQYPRPAVPVPVSQGGKEMIEGTPSGKGYYVAKADGSVFAYGDAQYKGGVNNAGPGGVTAMIPGDSCDGFALCPTGGYWLSTAQGHVYAFGGAPFYGPK